MSKQKNIIEIYVKGRENDLIERYIQDGPQKVKQGLKATDAEWQVVFDHLVFDHNMIYKCVIANEEFFTDIYIKQGMAKIRDILGIVEEKYNCFAEMIFEKVAIVNGGLYKHVLEHLDRYSSVAKTRGGDFVRKVLYLNKSKYKQHWKEVLDVLLQSFCNNYLAEQNFDKAMNLFMNMVNGSREHRLPFRSGLFVS